MDGRAAGRGIGCGVAALLALPGAAEPPARPASPAQAAATVAGERIEAVAVARIREEAAARSRILETVRHLTDVAGPRLTGSPGLRVAQAFARDRLKEWGLPVAALEPWGTFGRGWTLEGFALNLLAPGYGPMIGWPKAWCPSTAGLLRGEPVLFDPRSVADLERFKGRLKGRIVLASGPRPPHPPPLASRPADEEVLRAAEAPAAPDPKARSLEDLKWRMLYAEGPAAVLEPGEGGHGTLAVPAATVLPVPGVAADRAVRPWDLKQAPLLPQVVVAAEHYNRLARLAVSGAPVKVEVQVTARYHEEAPAVANLVAELLGGDLKDEVVLLSASLDSGPAAGASEAAGAAVAMEAMRILVATGLRPRRTIRLLLASGGAQGFLGLRGYGAAHFGRRLTVPDGAVRPLAPGPEHGRVAACFNLDGGPGRIRGLALAGQEPLRPVFRAWMAPFADQGVTVLAAGGPADPLEDLGLPAFRFLREGADPAEGRTNMDALERLNEEDLRQAAGVAAAFVYFAAAREQKLPRRTLLQAAPPAPERPKPPAEPAPR